MDAQAGMLARLFERSMGLGDEWEVSDVWFEERGGAQDELHVRVAHRKGQAVECPVCHRKCGTYDTREKTWRHLDIWQYETIVHCAVPRADCPEDGVHACRMPWEVRPNSHFTALFEAQVIVMALSGMIVTAMAHLVHETDTSIWRLLGKAVSEARDAPGRPDRGQVPCGAAPEQGNRSCEMCGEARVRREAPPARRHEVRLAEEEGVAHGAPACQEGGARTGEDPSQDGTRMPDGRGAPGRQFMRRQGIGGGGPRPPLLMDDALQRVRDEDRGEDAQEGAGGNPELVEEGLRILVPGRAQLRRPVGPQRCKGLQEHRLLQDDDLPPAGSPGLHGQEEAGMRYPLETSKSLKLAK